MSWKDLSFARKIALGFTIPLSLLILIGGWTFRSSQAVLDDVVLVREESAVYAQKALAMRQDVIQVQQWLTDISATRGLDGLDDGFAEAEASYQSFLEGLEQFRQMFERENDSQQLRSVAALGDAAAAYYEMGKKLAAAPGG